MTSVLSMCISANVGAFTDRLEDAGIDMDLAAQMGEALSNSDFQRLEKISAKVMSDNQISMTVKTSFTDVLKVTLDSNEFTMVRFCSEPWIPGTIVTLMLALLFKSAIPAWLLLPISFPVVGWGFLSMVFRKFLADLSKIRAKLCNADALMPALTSLQMVATSREGGYVIALADKAGCSPDVDKQVVSKLISMHAVAALYVVKEFCSNVNNVCLGRLTNRTGTMGFPARPVDDYRHELQVAQKTISELDEVIEGRVQSNKVVAKMAMAMDDTVDEVIGTLQLYEKTAIKFGFTAFRKDKMDRQRERVLETLMPALKSLSKQAKSMEVEKPIIDAMKVRQKCRAMVEIIGMNAALDKTTATALQEAIEARNKVSENYANISGERARLAVDINRKIAYSQQKQEQYDSEMAAMHVKLVGAKKLITVQGFMRMSGYPNDDISKEINRMWNKGQFTELRQKHPGGYSSSQMLSSFQFTVDPNPTKRQKECQASYDDLLKKNDDRMKQHSADMTALEGEIKTLQEKFAVLEKDAETAKAEYERVQSVDEPCMLTFKVQKPVEYAELKMMFKMQHMIQVCAAWMVEDTTKVGTLKALIHSLEWQTSEDDFDPTVALGTCLSIRAILSSPDQSPIGFLKNLPEMDLNRALMPAIDFSSQTDCVEQYLADFVSDAEKQGVNDALAITGGDSTPQVVD